MENFKITDLMISVNSAATTENSLLNNHFKIQGTEFEEGEATCRAGTCKATKAGKQNDADLKLEQEEESYYADTLWSLKQTIAGMQADSMSF